MKKAITILLIICIYTGCNFAPSSTKLSKGYQLTWIDSEWNQSIYKGEEQVTGYVFSVGFNDNFIIAKQHPLLGDFYSKPNYEITNYYIIDIVKNNEGSKKGVIGPLNQNNFNNELKRINASGKLKFTIN